MDLIFLRFYVLGFPMILVVYFFGNGNLQMFGCWRDRMPEVRFKIGVSILEILEIITMTCVTISSHLTIGRLLLFYSTLLYSPLQQGIQMLVIWRS